MSKQESGKDILNEVKNKANKKQKENNTMKTSKKTIVLTSIVTILIIAAIAAWSYFCFTSGMSYEKSKAQEIHAQVQSLTATVKK